MKLAQFTTAKGANINQISVSTNCFVAVKAYAKWDADASAAYINTERSCQSVHSAAAMNADAPAAAQ